MPTITLERHVPVRQVPREDRVAAHNKAVGQRLRVCRKERGYTLDEVGIRLNRTPTAISLWEKGTTAPHPVDIMEMASMFQTTAEFIMFGKVETFLAKHKQ